MNMIEVRNVTKKYGDFTAVKDLSLKVEDGSIYGLVGYNGAGKTTLLKMIAGVYRPDEGETLINGRNTFTDAASRLNMFYVPDELYFEPFSSIEKTAELYAGYYPSFSFETLTRLCGVFGLDKKAKLNSFSKGMRRQAEMILGMSALPCVLLLDESFDGLDPQMRSVMNRMLVDYVAERNCSVIISSHNLREIADICDHMALINGKSIALDCGVDDIGAERCRFRLVFDREMKAEDFAGIEVRKIKTDGKMVTLSAQGDPDTAEEKLRQMNPVLIERFPLTIEEVFLEEMEDKEYDFKEIFG